MADDHRSDDRHAWHERRIREWLLVLLRFAVTQAPDDRSATLAMADELDTLGSVCPSEGPRFFGRTTGTLCDAILTCGSNPSKAVLQQHLARIEDARLRRAFGAALDLKEPARPAPKPPERTERHDLWKGLPARGSARGHL